MVYFWNWATTVSRIKLQLETYTNPLEITIVTTFKEELEPILQELSATNNEVLICGDYNINLLKMNGETHYSDFFDMMLGHSFFPKITLPTRLNRTSGATLIDNIYYKLSFQTVKTTSGIILDELSDHYPYFSCLDNLSNKQTKPPRRVKQKINCTKAMENMQKDMLDTNIVNKFNSDLLKDPNQNYNILHEHLKSLKDKQCQIDMSNFINTDIRKISGLPQG